MDATHSQLTYTAGAIAEGGRFYGKKATARNYIRLDMRGESLYNSVWIRFSEAGSEVSTQGEAQKLQPLSEEYAILGVRKRSEEHTSELQSRGHLVCRLLLEKKKRT